MIKAVTSLYTVLWENRWGSNLCHLGVLQRRQRGNHIWAGEGILRGEVGAEDIGKEIDKKAEEYVWEYREGWEMIDWKGNLRKDCKHQILEFEIIFCKRGQLNKLKVKTRMWSDLFLKSYLWQWCERWFRLG